MAYNNKQYNTRFSGRYNTPGQFVPAGEAFGQTPRKQMQTQNLQQVQVKQKDEEMVVEPETVTKKHIKNEDVPHRPHWMKTKLPGVKKVSNKERRRRQNENLRRLLTPKNALMVLNEMMPNEQVANQFKVEPAANTQYNSYKPPNTHTFCADLTIEGNVYKGYGDNKLMARNAAAEQAIRDLIIKKMNKAMNSDAGSANGTDPAEREEESLPMIQLASFALHKLFTEWEYEGHKVPQLKPNLASLVAASESASESGGASSRRSKELPQNAGAMHPCMLLTYMRPHLEYKELAVEGDRPQNMLFTMAVDVDGNTYTGKASNKKEARKAAAKAACVALFKVEFETTPSATTPNVPAKTNNN